MWSLLKISSATTNEKLGLPGKTVPMKIVVRTYFHRQHGAITTSVFFTANEEKRKYIFLYSASDTLDLKKSQKDKNCNYLELPLSSISLSQSWLS